jgi:hypothetical protein
MFRADLDRQNLKIAARVPGSGAKRAVPATRPKPSFIVKTKLRRGSRR